jgi:hypothetical protein
MSSDFQEAFKIVRPSVIEAFLLGFDQRFARVAVFAN